jgi:hypothetical protein
MSISTANSSISYVGNNSTSTPYVVNYPFFDASDLKVYSVTSGTSTLLALTTNYTVTGGNGSTGSVTTTAAIPATSTVIISRNVPYTQLTSLTTGDRLPAASLEKALDKVTMQAQQLSRNTLPDTASTSGSAPFVLGVGAAGGSPSWVSQTASAVGDGSITDVKIANQAVTPAKLSTGGPTWSTAGDVTLPGGLSSGAITASGAISGTSLTASAPSVISVNSTSTALRVTQTGTGESFRVEDSTNPDSSPFVITSSGNVGVGTTSPNGKLDVRGNIQCVGDITAAARINALNCPSDIIHFNGAIADITTVTVSYVNASTVSCSKTSHGLQYNDMVTITLGAASTSGFFVVLDVIDANTFTMSLTGGGVGLVPFTAYAATLKIVRVVTSTVFDGYSVLAKSATVAGEYSLQFWTPKGSAFYAIHGQAGTPNSVSGLLLPYNATTSQLVFRTQTLGGVGTYYSTNHIVICPALL